MLFNPFAVLDPRHPRFFCFFKYITVKSVNGNSISFRIAWSIAKGLQRTLPVDTRKEKKTHSQTALQSQKNKSKIEQTFGLLFGSFVGLVFNLVQKKLMHCFGIQVNYTNTG